MGAPYNLPWDEGVRNSYQFRYDLGWNVDRSTASRLDPSSSASRDTRPGSSDARAGCSSRHSPRRPNWRNVFQLTSGTTRRCGMSAGSTQ